VATVAHQITSALHLDHERINERVGLRTRHPPPVMVGSVRVPVSYIHTVHTEPMPFIMFFASPRLSAGRDMQEVVQTPTEA
jgi:hypothetical protein